MKNVCYCCMMRRNTATRTECFFTNIHKHKHTQTKMAEQSNSGCAWTWASVLENVQNPDLRSLVRDLDSTFRNKDTTILYEITVLMIAVCWSLIVTVFASGQAVSDKRDTIVRVYCLAMMVFSLVFTVCRMWVIKFHMLHPALHLLNGGSAHVSEATRRYLMGLVIYFVVGICTAVAGAICLLSSPFNTQAAGVGLSVATTFILSMASVCYRWHAGVYVAAVGRATFPTGTTFPPTFYTPVPDV